MGLSIRVWVETAKGNKFELPLPAKRVVCPRCDGSGVHDHPSFSNGVSGLDDPDFAKEYFRGTYDVRCEECDGKNIVLVVDEDALAPKMLDRYLRAQDSKSRHEAEIASERRYFERASGDW